MDQHVHEAIVGKSWRNIILELCNLSLFQDLQLGSCIIFLCSWHVEWTDFTISEHREKFKTEEEKKMHFGMLDEMERY